MLEVLKTLAAQQAESHRQTLQTVEKMAEATKAQSEVLSSYLKLFQVPAGEQPERWTNEDPDTTAEMIAAGFPAAGSQAEQAKWVLDHLNNL